MALNRDAESWTPSPAAITAAESSVTRYTNGPKASEVPARYRSATRTQLPIAPGTKMLRDALVSQFTVRQTYMPGRSRPMADGDRLDLHQAGRAIDFMVYNDRAKGDAIANWCLENANAIGLQFLVWRGNRYSAGKPAGQRVGAYTGSNPHRDHPHVELTPEGAAGNAPWYAGRRGASAQELAQLASSEGAPFADHGGDDAIAAWIVPGSALVGVLFLVGVALVGR